MKKREDYTGISIIFLCHDGSGNFLFNKRSVNCRDEHGRWDCGGGGLDFGDSVEDTLRKEIREEYGTEVSSYEFLGYRDVHREHGGAKTHWITLDFKVLVDKGMVKNGEPHKFDEVEWFTLDNLPTPLYSQWSNFFEKYKKII
jgi:ADP-ribose pyrophosphatase YjhB (NUDIX family)